MMLVCFVIVMTVFKTISTIVLIPLPLLRSKSELVQHEV